MGTMTMNETLTAVKGSAEAVEVKTTPVFDVEKEYTFSIRSFRFRNGWAFCTVTYNGVNLEILIGQSADYQPPGKPRQSSLVEVLQINSVRL